MSPFHGQGANMAMLDALRLAEALALAHGKQQSLETWLYQFNDEMFQRTRPITLISRKAAQGFGMHSAADRRLRNIDLGLMHPNHRIRGTNIT
jgi:2-polyprenyl-6-methoxyphenol hydroxylase-like FAD-dependent oxidoreductase